MTPNLAKSLAWVLLSEGGNDDDPDDPGGRTHNGITQREYDAYCKLNGLPGGDVWLCPDQTRDDIYRSSYWLPYCQDLPSGVDYSFFDENVNAGLHEAVLILQRALGVSADGHIGPVTRLAWTQADPGKLVDAMAAQRAAVYRQTRGFWKYGNGWLARVETCRTRAHTLLN